MVAVTAAAVAADQEEGGFGRPREPAGQRAQPEDPEKPEGEVQGDGDEVERLAKDRHVPQRVGREGPARSHKPRFPAGAAADLVCEDIRRDAS